MMRTSLLVLSATTTGGIDRRNDAAGWSDGTAAPHEDSVPCTLHRLDQLDAVTFAEKYAGRRPFILSARGVNGTLQHHADRWERSRFLAEFGDTEVPLGKPNSREAVRIQHVARLRDYVNTLRTPPESVAVAEDFCQDDEDGSLYLFDRGDFFDRNPSLPWEWPTFLEDQVRTTLCGITVCTAVQSPVGSSASCHRSATIGWPGEKSSVAWSVRCRSDGNRISVSSTR